MHSNPNNQKTAVTTAVTGTANNLSELTKEMTGEIVRLRANLAHRANGGGPIPKDTLRRVSGVLMNTPGQLQCVVDTIKAVNEAIEGRE